MQPKKSSVHRVSKTMNLRRSMKFLFGVLGSLFSCFFFLSWAMKTVWLASFSGQDTFEAAVRLYLQFFLGVCFFSRLCIFAFDGDAVQSGSKFNLSMGIFNASRAPNCPIHHKRTGVCLRRGDRQQVTMHGRVVPASTSSESRAETA